MVRGVQRVLMLPVVVLRAARLRLARVLLRAVRCAPGADVGPGAVCAGRGWCAVCSEC